MKTKCSPTEWRQLEIEDVGLYRHIECDNYDNCLTLAISKDWTGFSCIECSMFESEVLIMPNSEIVEDIMWFLKEHELPQKNTVYNNTDCSVLVKETIRGLFKTINDLKKEKECVNKVRKTKVDRSLVYATFLREWNAQKIIHHKKATTRIKKVIDKILKNADYTPTEIFKAFRNYAAILKSPNNFWTYKWTMEDFLNRGLHKFVDEAEPFDNDKKEVKPVSNNPYMNFSCGGS